MLRQLTTFQTNLFSILHFVCDADEAEKWWCCSWWAYVMDFSWGTFFLSVDAHTSTTARVAETKLQTVVGQVMHHHQQIWQLYRSWLSTDGSSSKWKLSSDKRWIVNLWTFLFNSRFVLELSSSLCFTKLDARQLLWLKKYFFLSN